MSVYVTTYGIAPKSEKGSFLLDMLRRDSVRKFYENSKKDGDGIHSGIIWHAVEFPGVVNGQLCLKGLIVGEYSGIDNVDVDWSFEDFLVQNLTRLERFFVKEFDWREYE